MKHILSYLTITLFFTSCQLFEPKPESEKFYCKINGRAWRPEKKTLPTVSRSPLKAEWNTKGRFSILAFNEAELVSISIKLQPNMPIELKQYTLQSEISGSTGDYFYNSYSSPSERLTSTKGLLNITKAEKNLVSGTFEFTTYSDIKKKTYKITKGQFNDLAYTEF